MRRYHAASVVVAFMLFTGCDAISIRQNSAGVTAEQERLRGDWQMVRYAPPTNAPKVPFYMGVMTLDLGDYDYENGEWHEHGTYRIDPTKEPKRLDVTIVNAKGRYVTKQIYRLEGNTLTVAMAVAGKPRPVSFDVAPADDVSLAVYKRVPRVREAEK